ncbi:MAG: hypothetical protein B7Y89_07680 [Novosphingobium sp. 32-60-15]|nr:hypothetical protein [Novosphingobium sp. 32-60-15]OYX62759.1 MAG: hypothetical protein B7Y89_07680 [Novosphingobium sp. 32-60-15]
MAMYASLANQAQADIESIMGLPASPKIEMPKPAPAPFHYNNQTVTVTGGMVGAINFGNVDEIKVNLQSLTEGGSADIAEPLKKLTDAVLVAEDATETTKNELLEQIALLTAQASAKPEERKTGVIKALFGTVKSGTEAISSTAGAWQAVAPLLQGHFGL